MEKVEVDPILTERDWQDLVIMTGTMGKIEKAFENGTVTEEEREYAMNLMFVMSQIALVMSSSEY